MPLTPQDVRAKLFTSVRFKHGYDEDEVDAFLDQVESDLSQLYSQIESLTADLAIARSGAVSTPASEPASSVFEPDTASFEPVAEVPVSLTDAPSWARSASADVSEPPADEPDEPAVSTDEVVVPDADETGVSSDLEVAAPATGLASVEPSDGSPTEEMLRRTLILAQRTADALITEARTEAETLVADARAQAEQIERAAETEHSTRQRDLQAEHDHLNGLVEQLRGFENEYRSRLRAYLHLQLRDLESTSPAEPQPQVGTNGQAALDSADTGPDGL